MKNHVLRPRSCIISVLLLCLGLPLGCGKEKPKTHREPTVEKAVNLTSNSDSDDQNPAFSPEGENILFSSKRNGSGENLNIWKMDAEGEYPLALTSEMDADNVNMPGSSWCEMTDMVCFSSDRTGNDEIWMMNPDGKDMAGLTKNPASDWEPTFSPDGEWVVFQSDREGNWEIYKVNTETRETIRLTNDPADDWEPNWSPTGDRIVFQSNRDGNWDIYTMNTDGMDQQNVTDDPAEDTDPSWSPDGKTIAYSTDYGGQDEAEVYTISSDGSGKPARMTDDPAYDGAPSFSPDGKRIAFESYRSGNLDIWIIYYK